MVVWSVKMSISDTADRRAGRVQEGHTDIILVKMVQKKMYLITNNFMN